jgi:hypothetical protein
MAKIDKIIAIVREDIANVANAPSTGGGFGANSADPTAGFDPVMGFRRRRDDNIDGRSVNNRYKHWLKSMGLL